MTAPIHFYYDVASPYSYLSAHRLVEMDAQADVEVHWRPILLGGIFRATGNTMPAAVPAKARYLLDDLARWALRDRIPFHYSSSFPHNSLLAMRVLSAAQPDTLVELSMRLFRAAWVDDRNISEESVIHEVLGPDFEGLLMETQNPIVKDCLKQTTQEAIDNGAFGAPAFMVNNTLFWGNDRLDMAVDYAVSLA